MTPKEAFKIGFLEKCAEDGCTNEEIMQRISHAKFFIKSAGPVLDKVGGAVGGAARGTLDAFRNTLPWALLLPPAIGLGGGALLARAQDDAYDSEEARKREELAEYHRAIERLSKLRARQ